MGKLLNSPDTDFGMTYEEVFEILSNEEMSDSEIVHYFRNKVMENMKKKEVNINRQQEFLKKSKIKQEQSYYEALIGESRKLQLRVSSILLNIDFDEKDSNRDIFTAIKYFQEKDCKILNNAPIEFLDNREKKQIYDEDGRLNSQLYKILLFKKARQGLKSGSLNLKYSYRYKSIESYLINENEWTEKKEKIINAAGLSKFVNIDNKFAKLEELIDTSFIKVNQGISDNKNEHIKFNKNGGFSLQTPKIEKDTSQKIFSINDNYVSLHEILWTVNQHTGYLSNFEHYLNKYSKKNPEENIFYAGIVGLGCNIGLSRLEKQSKGITKDKLFDTVNWYFSEENLQNANNTILKFTEKLDIKNIFSNQEDIVHTSSDGQKFPVSVESLNANNSLKYFGTDKGVCIYSFIDEASRVFYSTVINASEREATYVIDGLLQNEVVKSDLHSTDTHGYSELIFGASYFLDFMFAPRIKNISQQRIYSFESIADYKDKNYTIFPDAYIKSDIIREQWDEILRFIATIRLRKAPASYLFNRLNSYSKTNPLYLALKEVGKIIKTLFILRYIDDVELRQLIEKQLNKVELVNKFAKAVCHGNNQELNFQLREEQNLMESCKRLIENAIICWNYLYLTEKVIEYPKNQKEAIIESIKNSSPVFWSHINFHGEYNFSEKKLEQAKKFDIDEILKYVIA